MLVKSAGTVRHEIGLSVTALWPHQAEPTTASDTQRGRVRTHWS